MILGLDGPSRKPLLAQARALGAPVLVSVNSLAMRQKDGFGVPQFRGFNPAPLSCLDGLDAHLDSAGFVAMVKYRGFDWTVAQYVAFAAAYPWRWFASMDACVEPEVAPDRATVLDRIAWTVALNLACAREARHLGCADRLMPVIQGARPEDYVRCLDMMAVEDRPLIGVGSMCRRHTGGLDGVVSCVDAIDRALGSAPTKLHLFGVKSDAAEALRAHPRIESADSQAYGVQARQVALRANLSRREQDDLFGAGPPPVAKDGAFVAGVMGGWYQRQKGRLARLADAPAVDDALGLAVPVAARHPWEAKVEEAREEMRALVAEGEMEWTDLDERRAWEWAFMDDVGEDPDETE